MRTIVIGDPHGCLEELQELVRTCEYNPRCDKVVLVGDLVDRGPDPKGVVQYARTAGFLSVMGNHDEKAVRHRRHELKKLTNPNYKNPMKTHEDRRAQWNTFDYDDWVYMEAMPFSIEIGNNWHVVHAGVHPWKSFRQQTSNEMMRIRTLTPEGKMIALGKPEPPGSFYWTTQWKGPESIIYGHNVVDEPVLTVWRNDKELVGVQTAGIDTGCCFGGTLTAAILDSDEPYYLKFVSVPAKAIYSVRKRYGEASYSPEAEE